MKKLIVFIFLVTLFYPLAASATPSISGVTGTLNDEQTGIVVAGSGFGTHPLEIEWTGTNIENGAVGAKFSKTSDISGGTWYVQPTSGWLHQTNYSNTDAHSGSQSIAASMSITGTEVSSPFRWMAGTGTYKEIPHVYLTYWVKNTTTYTACNNWKMWKIGPAGTATWSVDVPHSVYCTRATSSLTWQGNRPSCSTYSTEWYPSGTNEVSTSASFNVWERVEIYFDESTPNGTDGTFVYNLHKADGVHSVRNWVGTAKTQLTECSAERYITFMNYMHTSGTVTGTLYHDDIYFQMDSQARIEIGNASTFAACTHREIQIPTAWATGSATFTLNFGSFANDAEVYLFVVDSTGATSPGYSITLGTTGGSDTTAPVISGGSPSGEQACTADPLSVTLEATTDEYATMKYGLSGEDDLDTPAAPVDADTTYDLLPHTMTNTGETAHSQSVSSACDGSYTYYLRSMDQSENKNTSSTAISYSVAAAVEDAVAPTVTITSPADNPHTDTTQYITVSGTASANGVKTITSILASSPTMQSVGSVTGLTEWSVPVTVSQGTFSADLLYGAGAFASTGSWSVGTDWTIADSVASHTGTATNCWLGYTFASEIGKTYQVAYTVGAGATGTLYLSSYGFGGVTQSLDISEGAHTVDVVATRADSELAFVAYPFVGTLDSVTVKKVQHDVLTITATDSLGYTNTDTINLGYVAPELTSPRKVVGLSATVKIDLGGGVQLEF